jgi:hypothetical protein
MSCKRSSENRQVLVGFQSTESLCGLQHAGSGPAQRHRGILPSLHVAADATYGPHHVLDRVGASERAPQLRRQSKAVDGSISSSPSRMLAATPGAKINASDLNLGFPHRGHTAAPSPRSVMRAVSLFEARLCADRQEWANTLTTGAWMTRTTPTRANPLAVQQCYSA